MGLHVTVFYQRHLPPSCISSVVTVLSAGALLFLIAPYISVMSLFYDFPLHSGDVIKYFAFSVFTYRPHTRVRILCFLYRVYIIL
jgi:hypothetical protein